MEKQKKDEKREREREREMIETKFQAARELLREKGRAERMGDS